MKIDVELYEQIRELYVHGGLSQREIAKKLEISRTTVKKYCDGKHVPGQRIGISGRHEYVITPEIRVFIESCFEEDRRVNLKKQKHTAQRIYARLVEEHGFTGGKSTVRRAVADIRQQIPKVFIPLSYELAEAAQIDWGEASVYLNGIQMKVNLFCMRLCNSAAIFVKAYYRQNEESFLEANVSGFHFFGGAPRKVIFDNAKVAVKDGFGAHAQPQRRYRELSAHYAFKTEFCNVASGHEKGLVEGLVGYIRRNHLVPLPKCQDIDELNEFLELACQKYMHHKIEGRSQKVGEMFEIEQPYLTPLPAYTFDASKVNTRKVNNFSTVSFDYNRYSVPVIYAGKTVSVKGYGNQIEVYYQHEKIAQYTRAYTRDETYYELEHYMPLIDKRPRSVFNAQPVKDTMSADILKLGERLSGPREMVRLLRLCLDHGGNNVLIACRKLSNGELTVDQIQMILTKPLVPKQANITDLVAVKKVTLSDYDGLFRGGKNV
ncbi:MAG: IS21 family transposase [Culicoidibacterales bacterium]